MEYVSNLYNKLSVWVADNFGIAWIVMVVWSVLNIFIKYVPLDLLYSLTAMFIAWSCYKVGKVNFYKYIFYLFCALAGMDIVVLLFGKW